jgi:hypothetical protein
MILLDNYGYAILTFALCTIAVVYPDRPWPTCLVGGSLIYIYAFDIYSTGGGCGGIFDGGGGGFDGGGLCYLLLLLLSLLFYD